MSDDGFDDAAWAPRAAGGSSAASLLPGYRDVVQVARGGDSIVYRAHQDALDRDVAIKVVELDDPESVARFRRELSITVQLGRQHPNIMTVLATGTTTAGQPCLVMDYVELGSLHDRLLTHGPLPVSEVVAAGTVIADALAFAHGQGVLHRDVKPQNVLVLPTSWVLADFGLARAVDAGHSASLERFSYRHASPQILDGEAPTIADDVYSLGSTLYTLLDGRAPFASDDPDEDSALAYLRRARTGTPRPLTRTDLPPALVRVVLRCLARSRAERFATAQALRDALAVVPTESRRWAPDGAGAPLVADVDGGGALDEARAFGPPPADPVPPAVTSAEPAAAPLETGGPASEPAAPEQPAPPVEDRPPAPLDEPAPSALAQLPATPTTVDEPTGLRPAGSADGGTDGGADGGTDEGVPAQPVRHRSRGRAVLLAAAAVVALAAGVGVGLWRSGGDDSAAPPPATASPSPTVSPTASGTASAQRSSASGSGTSSAVPAFATDPRITSYTRNSSTSVALGWTDPSGGQDSFFVAEITDTGVEVVPGVITPGTTGSTVPDVQPGRHCFRVTMIKGESEPGSRLQAGPIRCKTT